jgi:Fe-S-cluster-containing hydrogenase component 2
MVKGKRKPVAIIECRQEIPCNPCEAACPSGAIEVGLPITRRPRFHADRCKGCGRCIPFCPGLAIFLIDRSYSEKEALIAFPHEFLPLPRKNEEVDVIDREGRVLGKGRIVRIDEKASNDRTPVVYVAVSKRIGSKVRGMVRLPRGPNGN